MASPQQLVDDIRSFLQSTDQTFHDQLKPLAADYAAACADVNQRLRRCEEYLQRGLRSEAIQFAQTEPVLLDILAVLDFPERANWERFAAHYQLAAPPGLRVDTAEALNRAYAEEQPMEAVLRQHRRLALARAPLPQRIAVLRQLSRLDSGNSVWEGDISELEQVRLRQLQGEIDRALRHKDAGAIQALGNELLSSPLRDQLPPELMAKLAEAAQTAARALRFQHLGQLASSLHDAHGALDAVRVRKLADEWKPLAAEVRLAPEDPLSRAAAPALKWLAKQDKREGEETLYQDALANLQDQLYRERSFERLEALHEAVERFPQGVPAELQLRYERRLEELNRLFKRREVLMLAATVAVCLLILLGMIFVIGSR